MNKIFNKKLIAYLFVAIMLIGGFASLALSTPNMPSSNAEIPSYSSAGSINVGSGSCPWGVAYDSSNQYIYVSNSGTDYVSVISGTSVIANITVGPLQSGIAYDPENNYIYVTHVNNLTALHGEVSVISGTSVIATIGGFSAPIGIAYDSSNHYIYVANGGSTQLFVISGTSVIGSVNVSEPPWGVAYDPADNYIYATDYKAPSGTVFVISGTSVIANVTVGSYPTFVGFDPSNNYMYVSNYGSDYVSVISGTSVIANVTVGPGPDGVAYDPENNYMYIATSKSNSVSVVSGTSLIANVTVGPDPNGVAYDPADNYIYVANEQSNTVSYFNDPPVLSVTISPSKAAADVGQSVTFRATASGGTGSYAYQWYENGSAIAGATASSYTATFSSVGVYKVYVIVSDYGNATSNIINETVNPDPSVKITAPQNPAYVGIPITIIANISGGTAPFNETWYINNIKASFNTSLVFNESSPGSYNISLIVRDSAGMIADSNVIDENVDKPYMTVTYSHPPIASQSVTIYAHVLNNSANYSLYWTFSGRTATGHNVTYAFSTAGYREFTIKMTNSAGYSETQTFKVFVSLYITISASPKSGNAPLTVDFSSETLGGSSYIYLWNFGNGNTSDSEDATNIFSAGNYTVTLTVTDSAGVTGNATIFIQSLPPPVLRLSSQ